MISEYVQVEIDDECVTHADKLRAKRREQKRKYHKGKREEKVGKVLTETSGGTCPMEKQYQLVLE